MCIWVKINKKNPKKQTNNQAKKTKTKQNKTKQNKNKTKPKKKKKKKKTLVGKNLIERLDLAEIGQSVEKRTQHAAVYCITIRQNLVQVVAACKTIYIRKTIYILHMQNYVLYKVYTFTYAKTYTCAKHIVLHM